MVASFKGYLGLQIEDKTSYFYPVVTMVKLSLMLKRILIRRKRFLNYSTSKMTLQNILQNFIIYLFKYFV